MIVWSCRILNLAAEANYTGRPTITIRSSHKEAIIVHENVVEMVNAAQLTVAELRQIFSEMNMVDIAETFDNIDREKIVQIFRLLPKSIAADVFSYIEPDKQQIIVETLTDHEVQKIVDDLFVDDAVDFIEEMPANVVKKVLRNSNPDMRDAINMLLKYPENSAGSIMTTEYVDLKKDMTVTIAIERLRRTAVDRETINNCYVLDSHRVLEGAISLRCLLLGKDDEKIENLMETNLISVETTDDQEIVSSICMKYDLFCVPVVDHEKRLVGIITIDDIVDVIQDENTEDFEIMAAMIPSERPYLKTGVLRLTANRIPWLLFLMLSATLTGIVISLFENQLAAQTALISFIPMLMNTGGNSGSQASTTAIRGMVLNEIKLSNFFNILRKEFLIGIMAGCVLALINFLRIVLLKGDPSVALTVSLSLIGTVVLANVIGGLLPLGAKALKVDPALMASPMISTIVDVCSLILYFTIAKFILNV